MEWLKAIAAAPIGTIWFLAGPVTYIVAVVDTWQGQSSVVVKILINLTLDAFLAMIWPITWVLWLVWELMDKGTPLSRVLGLF